MKVLLVRMSSLGDVIHALPAVSDALAALPDLELDWVVEEAFVEIPAMHEGVRRTIPIALRRWRRNPTASVSPLAEFARGLRREQYDLIIDAQGLLKSALVGLLARGPIAGLNWGSARESLASLCYSRRFAVASNQHAVQRWRELFAQALGYQLPQTAPDFGLRGAGTRVAESRLMFLHGTTWPSKHWPEEYWRELAALACGAGYTVVLPGATPAERERAQHIAASVPGVEVLAAGGLASLAEEMRRCAGAVTVDSGPGHLAGAIGVPLIALFGPTNPRLTAPPGLATLTLASNRLPCIPCVARECRLLQPGQSTPPCFDEYGPAAVWQALDEKMRVNAQ
ncbi:MAG: lipopolysaccharide heptosyltransferase I [Pseudomonadota bacterium]